MPGEHLDGDIQVVNMQLGGAQENVLLSQSICLRAKGLQGGDWVGCIKELPRRGELERQL